MGPRMLSLSRRALLASISSILLPAQKSNFLLPTMTPTNTGRINLTLNGLTHYMAFYAFLNAWKCGAPIQVVNADVNYWSDRPPGSKESAWGIFLDTDGELINPLPENTSRME